MKKRPLGQNFLVDREIAREIVHLAEIGPQDSILEIGPGKGILTEYLLDVSREVVAIEIDPKLCSHLRKQYGHRENFRLLEEDALKFDYNSLAEQTKVVSNLPYYAATHILKRLINYHSRIGDMTVMLQKEVVDRLMALPGQKEYGSLSVFIQFHCDLQRLLEVKREAFSPPPKIDSSVVKLIPLRHPRVKVEDPKVFFKIVQAAFFHKRKMLKNNLKVWEKQFHLEKDKISLAGIDLSRRGETLTLEDFAVLSNYIHSRHA